MWTVHASVVETSIRSRDLAVLAVGVVEVGHTPAILLVLVVVGVGGPVLGRSDGLGVGSGGPIVEVDLTACHLPGLLKELLVHALALVRPDADHPDEEDQEDDKEDSSSDTAGNVGKLGLLLAVGAGEGSDAGAIWFTLLVLKTLAVVDTEPIAQVSTRVLSEPSSVVAILAGADEVIGRLNLAERVLVAQVLLSFLHKAGVGAVSDRDCS